MPDTRDIGVWSNKFRSFALPFMRIEGVTDVASEAPLIVPHRKKDPNTGAPVGPGHIDMKVVTFHVGILVTIEQVRAELELPPVVTYIRGTVGKHFTSSGKGPRADIKKRFVLYAQAQGWNHNGAPITDENIADAAGTLDLFLHERKAQTPWSTAPRHPLFTAAGAAPTLNQTEDRAVGRLAQSAMRFNERAPI